MNNLEAHIKRPPCISPQRPRFMVDVCSVVSVLYLTEQTHLNRKGMYQLASTCKSLGYQMTDVTLSTSTIRRCRMSYRKVSAIEMKRRFSGSVSNKPLTLHWDGKLLIDITQWKKKVDRIAILVTGKEIERLLGVVKIEEGTGLNMARVFCEALVDWQIRDNIQSLCFDTTSLNTGLIKGACTQIEKELDRELLWLACRHHIYEVILAGVFEAKLGSTSAPFNVMFSRFQSQWGKVDKSQIQTIDVDERLASLFNAQPHMETLRQVAITFARDVAHRKSIRGDYKELVQLVLIFCGDSGHVTKDKKPLHFSPPGAISNARWMMRAIYALKIYLFRKQFPMSASELRGITDVALFVALVYMKRWIEAPLSVCAPRNDLNFMQHLETYCTYDKVAGEAALRKMSAHLWYLSELPIALAFFDDGVSIEEKMCMVQHLEHQESSKCLKKLPGKGITFKNRRLSDSVTVKTKQFFDMLSLDSSFLCDDPNLWPESESYQEGHAIAKLLVTVNDCAERGSREFNETVTKDEDQRQYLLLVVDAHRKAFRDCN